jgi:hypothetical protein
MAWAMQIGEPSKGQIWNAGTEVAIKWDPQDSQPDSLVDVDLLVGPGQGVVVMEIASSIPSSQGQTNWAVSKYLSSRSDYFVRLSSSQDDQELAKSHRFKIKSPDQFLESKGAIEKSSGFSPLATGSRMAALVSLIFALLFVNS